MKSQDRYTTAKMRLRSSSSAQETRKRGTALNILPGLVESDPELFTLLLATADIVPDDPRLDRPPCVQLMAAEAWTESVSGLSYPDYEFGVAEAQGRVACWRAAAYVRNNPDTVWLYPDEASHSPRLMMFGLEASEDPSEGETAVLANFLTWDLPFDWSRAEVAAELMEALKGVQAGGEPSSFWGRFRLFRKQSCRLNRKSGRGCVKRTCAGKCKPYKVSDGAAGRDLCACI